MKKIVGLLIIVIIMSSLTINVYGYENETYKIDVPNEYKEIESNGSCIFSKSKNLGIVILSVEANGLKKDFNTMSRTEMNQTLDRLFGYSTNIINKEKEKIGSSKSIKARLKSSNSYMDVYIVTSDKHIMLIGFIAPTEDELDSQEYDTIKKSFKMKEKTTNVTLLCIVIYALAIGGGVIGYIRKRKV